MNKSELKSYLNKKSRWEKCHKIIENILRWKKERWKNIPEKIVITIRNHFWMIKKNSIKSFSKKNGKRKKEYVVK